MEGNAQKIFLMPGFDGTGELFYPITPLLGCNIVVVRYKDECVFDDYVESVADLLPKEDAVLIAESFSGPVALALMARYPERIRCTVLCATFAVSPFRFLTRLARFVPSLFFGPNPTQRMILKTFCLDNESDPALLSKAVSVIRSVPARTLKSRFGILANIDMEPILSCITTKILYLQAKQDKIVAPDLSRQLVQGLPNASVCEVGGPHLLLQSRPNECAEIIKSFANI